MTLEGIFIGPTSTTTAPDLSLHISPPTISSLNSNYEPHESNFPSRTTTVSQQAHTELSLEEISLLKHQYQHHTTLIIKAKTISIIFTTTTTTTTTLVLVLIQQVLLQVLPVLLP